MNSAIEHQIRAELARIHEGPKVDENPRGAGTVRFLIRCPLRADHVLRDVKDVLRIVAENSLSEWPECDAWREILPRWFVHACPPELNSEEAARWLAEWRDLTPGEQAERENEREWPLEDW